MVSSVPILRIGNALVALKERLASIQYLQNFFRSKGFLDTEISILY